MLLTASLPSLARPAPRRATTRLGASFPGRAASSATLEAAQLLREAVRVPEGEKVESAECEVAKPWWESGPELPNMFTASTVDELRAVLEMATRGVQSRLVAVEFIAGHCPACRRLYPKLVRMAAEEFQHVVFVKVFADHSQELAEALGVNAFPSIHLFAGPRATRVAKFTANMSAEGLARIRLFLSHWSHPDNSHADAVAARAGAEGVVLL